MKQLQKSDLKEGEIYKQLDFDYIFLYNKNETSDSFNDGTAISATSPRYCKRWTANGFEKDMIEATPEEKHWLETCIKANEFVSYEEAMKTFIPEYVEAIQQSDGYTIGKIYKNLSDSTKEWYRNIDDKNRENGWSYLNFKPSTKEAYDAQFVVKEPEFVLPEKWQIKRNKENHEIINNWMNNHHKDKITYGTTDYASSKYFANNFNLNKIVNREEGVIEITFDQFKQYVLKENTTVTKEPKVVLEEPKDKVLAHLIQSDITLIHSVECSEGGIYKIGDKIKVFDKYSPNKGKSFTIKSFRWSNDKSKICAVTELHTSNGIGLNKIELYVEPKVKVKDDFVLPEKWCVKVNFEIRNRFSYCDAYGYHHSIRVNQANKWSINIKEGFTEIAFEKFKKYVLKDE